MATIKTILYKQKTLTDGRHPVMLYIYEDKIYRVSLDYKAFSNEWNTRAGKFKKNYINAKTKNLNLRKKELLAHEIIDDFARKGEFFEIETFKKLFKGEKPKQVKFYEFCEQILKEKEALGKIGTMLAYKDAVKTLKRFKPQDFNFEKLTYSLLKEFEISLFARGCTAGGIGCRMRAIKAIFYEGMRRKLVDKEKNPYSTIMNKDGYSLAKLKSVKNPKALSKEDLEKFKSFDLEKYPHLANAWRYFMFSFKLFGINFIDMCHLKNINVIDGRLEYTRQKTNKPFSLYLTEEAKEIIKYFQSDKEYLFPIFDEKVHITAKQKKNRSHRVRREVNKALKQIAVIQGIRNDITFYTARHTSATTLKRKGTSTDVISEALGHSSLSVTQLYLSKFENKVLDKAIMNL